MMLPAPKSILFIFMGGLFVGFLLCTMYTNVNKPRMQQQVWPLPFQGQYQGYPPNFDPSLYPQQPPLQPQQPNPYAQVPPVVYQQQAPAGVVPGMVPMIPQAQPQAPVAVAPVAPVAPPTEAPTEAPGFFKLSDWVIKFNVSEYFKLNKLTPAQIERINNPPPKTHEGNTFKFDPQQLVTLKDIPKLYEEDDIVVVEHYIDPAAVKTLPIMLSGKEDEFCSHLTALQPDGEPVWYWTCHEGKHKTDRVIAEMATPVVLLIHGYTEDPNSKHGTNVPAMNMNHKYQFRLFRWTNIPISFGSSGNFRIEEHEQLYNTMGSWYVTANGHFVVEVLPRLLRALGSIPPTAKVLIWKDGGVPSKIYPLLHEHGILDESRVVNYAANQRVMYYAKHYFWCDGAPYSKQNMRLVSDVFRRMFKVEDTVRDQVIVINRGSGARHISKHQEMVDILRNEYKMNVSEFRPMSSIGEEIKFFARAKCIIGPHGAGMFNVLWSQRGIPVMEIGYKSGMAWPDMYYEMSVESGHPYWTMISDGDYGSEIHPDMNEFRRLFSQMHYHMQKFPV